MEGFSHTLDVDQPFYPFNFFLGIRGTLHILILSEGGFKIDSTVIKRRGSDITQCFHGCFPSDLENVDIGIRVVLELNEEIIQSCLYRQ